MGTSTSSSGPGSNSPLVPPWADSDPDKPLETPPPQRFKQFRTELGKFAASGRNINRLKRALGHYASTSTGGSAVGPRRFGSMADTGGTLAGLFNELRDGGDGSRVGVHLPDLVGRSVDDVIDEIANALMPQNGDADKTRLALTRALSECLDGMESFDPSAIDDSMIIDMVVFYVGDFVFQQILLDSNKAFQRCETASEQISAENDLYELVSSAVDRHLRDHLNRGELNPDNVRQVQLGALKEVWQEWEAEL